MRDLVAPTLMQVLKCSPVAPVLPQNQIEEAASATKQPIIQFTFPLDAGTLDLPEQPVSLRLTPRKL